MVDMANTKTMTSSRYFPTTGMRMSYASRAIESPATPSVWKLPAIMIGIAVRVQTSPESIAGPSIATSPSRTGSAFIDAPCIIPAVPTPASLTYMARRAPMMAVPTMPPMPACRLNAPLKMAANVDGSRSRLVTIM